MYWICTVSLSPLSLKGNAVTTSCYLKAISGREKGVREAVDSTFAGILVQPMRQQVERQFSSQGLESRTKSVGYATSACSALGPCVSCRGNWCSDTESERCNEPACVVTR
jgi:hypothetical protein